MTKPARSARQSSPHVLWVLSVLCVLCSAFHALAAPITFDAYTKSFFTVYDPPHYRYDAFSDESPSLGQVTNRARISSRLKLSSDLRVDLAYDLIPQVQDKRLFSRQFGFALINPYRYRATDFDRRLYPDSDDDVSSFAILHNLDRAFVTLRTGKADVYLGRQAIAFGSARIVNPTDVLAPFSYETLDTEDRIGIDALRVRIALGLLSELDLGFVFGEDFESDQNAQFIRAKLYLWRSDVTVMALNFRKNLLLGFDLARAAGQAGIWLETAYVFADAFGNTWSSGNDYLRLSIGGDYNLAGDVYVFTEYHYNGPGRNEPSSYLAGINPVSYSEGSVYLLGKHYLAPGVNWQITPLITGSAEVLTNLSDLSAFLAPKVSYNACPNIDVSIGFFIGLGESPHTLTNLRSEFGAYPDIGYTSIRIYF